MRFNSAFKGLNTQRELSKSLNVKNIVDVRLTPKYFVKLSYFLFQVLILKIGILIAH